MTADIITFSRIVFSVLLLVFAPYSIPFTVFYLLCGVSDVLDGFAARKLHTESERGAMLDSIADLFFAVIYAVRILPRLSFPYWIWIWIAFIAVIKIAGIAIASKKAHRLSVAHSFGNKLTGILIFLLPLSVPFADAKYGAVIVCFAAAVTAIAEMIKSIGGTKNDV